MSLIVLTLFVLVSADGIMNVLSDAPAFWISFRQNVPAIETSPVFNYHQFQKFTIPNQWAQNLPNKNHQDEMKKFAYTAPQSMLRSNPLTNADDRNSQFPVENYEGFIDVTTTARLKEGSFCRRNFDGQSGYCIIAYNCLHVMKEYRNHGAKIDICTHRKTVPVICCPLADKHVSIQRISAKKCRANYDALKDVKISLSHTLSGKVCVPSVPMIVGGEMTHGGEYPHMAALGWTQRDKKIKWSCGGSLISENFVLTAAHCITTGEKQPDVVRLGTTKLNDTSSKILDVKILIIFIHPKYTPMSHYHDIALLKLAKNITFSSLIRPACLWQLPELKIQKTIAAGWGATEFNGKESETLRRVDLNLIDQNACKNIYREEPRLPRGIIDEQFCAGTLNGGKDTCQGDSGGPLMAELPEYNCVKFIVGITSFGTACAQPGAPGVYTKIYPYLDWIEKIAFKN